MEWVCRLSSWSLLINVKPSCSANMPLPHILHIIERNPGDVGHATLPLSSRSGAIGSPLHRGVEKQPGPIPGYQVHDPNSSL